MFEREYPGKTKGADDGRSSKDIRQDIAKGEEEISQTVNQINERIREKLDWRGYVREYPYWAIGGAAGIGYLASGMFITQATPMERIMDSIAGEVRESLDGLLARNSGTGVVRMTLLGIATRAAAIWIKNSTLMDMGGGNSGNQPVRDSTDMPIKDSTDVPVRDAGSGGRHYVVQL